jgi:hypothetical protein
MPFSSLLSLATLAVRPGLGCGDAERDNLVATCRGANFGSRPRLPMSCTELRKPDMFHSLVFPMRGARLPAGVGLSDAVVRNRDRDRPPPSARVVRERAQRATRPRCEPKALCGAKRGCEGGIETGLDRRHPRRRSDAGAGCGCGRCLLFIPSDFIGHLIVVHEWKFKCALW